MLDYERDKVFYAIEKAIPNIKGMKLIESNSVTKRLIIKSGGSMLSPGGESITITLESIESTKTRMSIVSQTKVGLDGGKNKKNVNTLIDEISKYIE